MSNTESPKPRWAHQIEVGLAGLSHATDLAAPAAALVGWVRTSAVLAAVGAGARTTRRGIQRWIAAPVADDDAE